MAAFSSPALPGLRWLYFAVLINYKNRMKNKPLSQTNEQLRDPEKRRRALLRSVLSSSAVEGINLTAQDVDTTNPVQTRDSRSVPTDSER